MITSYSKHDVQPITLHDYISIPSEIHVYSLGVEYMKDWFLSQFDNDYFKTVYINGKHIFDDYRHFNKERLTKQTLIPAVAIIPTVDMAYNRDTVDLKQWGRQSVVRRSRYFDDALVQDYDNNIFLYLFTKAVKMNFTFRVRVQSRAQQIDLANFMKFAFRVGSTQAKNVDYDFHIPKEILLNIAQSAGYELMQDPKTKEIKVKDNIAFLKYLNKRSMYPIFYKMRTINGNSEFFFRMPGLYTHISNLDELTLDDGERVDQIDSRFHIEMNCELTIPAPQYYYYASLNKVDAKFKQQKMIAGLYEFRNMVSPEKDEHGWRQYLSTEYTDEDRSVKVVNIKELLEDKGLMWVIQRTLDTFISPKIFINIKAYNNRSEVPINIDWETFDLKFLNEKDLEVETTDITIYVDLEYVNEQLKVIQEMDQNRMKEYQPAPTN